MTVQMFLPVAVSLRVRRENVPLVTDERAASESYILDPEHARGGRRVGHGAAEHDRLARDHRHVLRGLGDRLERSGASLGS